MLTHTTGRAHGACLAAAALVLCQVSAWAQAPQKTVVRLSVNHVEKGDVVVLGPPAALLIRVTDLGQAGLSGFDGERETVAGELYVSLLSLAPAVTFTLDEKELTLEISARDDLLGHLVLDLSTAHPKDIVYTRDTSAFLNYALTERRGEPFSVTGEAGISLGGPLLFSSFSQLGGRFVRGLTSITLDDREHLRRWVIGDTPPNSISPAGGLPLLGFGVSRNFSLDPYVVRVPSLGFSTSVDTPSTLQVYMNGRLVHEEQVQPGQLDLRNLPAVQGNGSVRLVLRDAFGREREIVSHYYLANRVLARGTSEYSYNVGLLRRQTGLLARSYGPLAFLASHRTGITSALTAGFHVEALGGLVSGGPSIAARLPLGEVEISTTGSTLRGKPGVAASFAYSYMGPHIGFGVLARGRSIYSPSFDLTMTSTQPVYDANFFVSVPLPPRATLSVQYGSSEFSHMPWAKVLSVIGSVRLASRMTLTFSARRSTGGTGQPDNSVFAGLSYFMGKRTVASAGLQADGSGAGSNLQISESLPAVGNGFGYRLQSQTGPSGQFSGLIQYQGPYGRYEANYSNLAGASAASFTASGSVTAVGGRVHLAQPVQEAFGLLRLPGLPGVPGYVENQEVGRTDSHGDLIIPALLPYYGNRVKIDAEQMPVNSDIGVTEKLVAPSYRAGALISFPVQRVQAITGNLIVEAAGKSVVPTYGDLAVIVAGKRVVSPVGTQGQFYFENLAPGRHPAKLEGGEQECAFTMAVPASAVPFLRLGALRCVAEPEH